MMRRADWTPVVLITASVSVTVVAFVLLTTPWLRAPFSSEPGPTQERRNLSTEFDVWVGEVAPGVVGLLAPVWGEEAPDLAHDRKLNEELALGDDRTLAWYHLLLFNRSEEAQAISLADGLLTLRPEDGTAPVASVNVAGMVARGEATLTPALETVLRARGALDETLRLPGGWMADVFVAFERRIPLDLVAGVRSASGTAFRERPMGRGELERLMTDPEESEIEDL